MVYPKGYFRAEAKAVSVFLHSCSYLLPEHKFFAEFKLRIRDQFNNNHLERRGKLNKRGACFLNLIFYA
jgi:hypothetical protein